MNNPRDLLTIGSGLPMDAAYEIDFVAPRDGKPAHYLATVADSKLRENIGCGPTRADALQEAIDRYLTAKMVG
jgi:hypothetical protein